MSSAWQRHAGPRPIWWSDRAPGRSRRIASVPVRGEPARSETLYHGAGEAGQPYAFGVAEAWLGRHPDLERFAARDAFWRGSDQPATARQIQVLRRLGSRSQDVAELTKEQASRRITELSAQRDGEPATARQLWKLRQLGIAPPQGLGKREAGRLIGRTLRGACADKSRGVPPPASSDPPLTRAPGG